VPRIRRRYEVFDVPAAEPGPEWVLSRVEPRSDLATESELLKAARSAWPKVLARVQQEQSHNRIDDDGILATEVWEAVLQSVSKTLERTNGRHGKIRDLEGYLLGTFNHRFKRALKKEQCRQETIQLVSSLQELEERVGTSQAEREFDIDGDLHAQEIFQRMDAWSRKIWAARDLCDYSWNEIGRVLGIPGLHVMLRFRRRMSVLRERLSGGR
jgi:DNA-directed RNA polymerase specialized sigma24 family protein